MCSWDIGNFKILKKEKKKKKIGMKVGLGRGWIILYGEREKKKYYGGNPNNIMEEIFLETLQ